MRVDEEDIEKLLKLTKQNNQILKENNELLKQNNDMLKFIVDYINNVIIHADAENNADFFRNIIADLIASRIQM